MLNKKLVFATLSSLILGFTSLTANAMTAEEQKGLEISLESKKKDEGWADSSADMLMILKNKQGQESIREIKMKSLEIMNDGDKSLTIFNKPRDVKGTAFLSFSHPVEADEQWLFLPALKRVKRISSRNKSGPFMGSEFAFEDLSSFEVEKYTYKYLGDEAANGEMSFKVEQYPVDENSGYTRRIVWIDQSEYRVQKIEFYDRKNTLLKTLTFSDYKQYLDKHWRADVQHMVNHQSGKSTELKWSNYQFKTGLKDSDFNRNSLKRAR
ncbi:outer membrane lipoprotein-sorting protein [Litorilituus lipolyticus]|uniref:Outer membrane lipoprotein-sorting protein n=1 Tax=Litorilituus lipolyticus TaxID=2491017 RepID=A0A502KWW0_9GAMM|nr:outer membrane lipoprotein-sorting protein [Litorilituus lipolyticus]TPH14705.1 outer membrane lipoprotein-sorting protein [Litorilituus lipolyticus]